MLRRVLLALALLATGEAAKAKADPKECEVCIANLEAIDKLIDKDEKTSKQSIMEAITKHTAASSPRNDLVKNYRHPTHWLISTQASTASHVGPSVLSPFP